MKIQSSPLPAVPRALLRTDSALANAAPLSPATSIRRIHPLSQVDRPAGAAPIYRISVSGATGESDLTPALGYLRAFTHFIAEHCGRTAKIVDGVVWLSVDGKNLYDHWHDPSIGTFDRVVELGEAAASVLSVIGTVQGSERFDAIGTPIHFVAQIGDRVHRGQFSVNASDLAVLSSEKEAATMADLLKLSGL